MFRQPVDALAGGSDVRQAIARFLREARSASGARLNDVILYGSVARGEAGPASDVDLLVVWDGEVMDALDVLVPIASRILLETGVDISVHPRQPDEMEHIQRLGTAFYENLEREGVRVDG